MHEDIIQKFFFPLKEVENIYFFLELKQNKTKQNKVRKMRNKFLEKIKHTNSIKKTKNVNIVLLLVIIDYLYNGLRVITIDAGGT